MKLLLFILSAVFLGLSAGQNAPAVNWTLVQPIHAIPSFFNDFPFLRELSDQYRPVILGFEGQNATRNQFAYQVM